MCVHCEQMKPILFIVKSKSIIKLKGMTRKVNKTVENR